MGNRPAIRSFFDEATHTVTHLVADPASSAAAVIDPVLDFDPASGETSREGRDAELAVPKLLYPSIQVNIRVGWLPDPEPNGRRYIRIPLDGTTAP